MLGAVLPMAERTAGCPCVAVEPAHGQACAQSVPPTARKRGRESFSLLSDAERNSLRWEKNPVPFS